MSKMDRPKDRQTSREPMPISLGELGEKIEAMRRGLVELMARTTEQQHYLDEFQEKNKNNPGSKTHIDEMAAQIKRNQEALGLDSAEHTRALGQYKRRESQLQKIKNRKKSGK